MAATAWSFANAVSTTLQAGLSAVAQGATDYVTPASKTGFPTSGQFPILVENEIMLVTNPTYSASQWQVLRGQEGTTAPAHNANVGIVNPWTAAALGAFARVDGSAQATQDDFGLRVSPSVTAGVDNVAYGESFYPTLTAHANSDTLIGFVTSPTLGAALTFATAGFTGLTAHGHYINGPAFTKTGGGTIATATGLYVVAPTIGTNNYAAIFTGGNVGIGTSSPVAPLHIQAGSGASGTLLLQGNATGPNTYVSAPGAAGAIVVGTAVGDLAVRVAASQSVHLDASGGATPTVKVREGNHLIAGGAAPSVSNQQGGTVVTAVSAAATDTAGYISITTGTTPPAGGTQISTVTWAAAFASQPISMARASNSGGVVDFTASNSGTASCIVWTATWGSALTASSTYTINLITIGR